MCWFSPVYRDWAKALEDILIMMKDVAYFTQAGSAPSRLFVSPHWVPFGGWAGAGLSPADLTIAAQAIEAYAHYEPTPLLSLPGLAQKLGVADIRVKDEAQRFGRGGVKALGAPYALQRLLGNRPCADFVAVAATDGNHGLALAWAARRLGCRSRIFVGQAVDALRLNRIRDAGGDIQVVAGTYDDAVAAAQLAAQDNPHMLLVTDTDHSGELPVTRDIMAGYSVLGREVCAQTDARAFTHLFVQCGVGGIAAGIMLGLWHAGACAPRTVMVEPATAASMLASLQAGRPELLDGDLQTRMQGLSCGMPSLPAWRILQPSVFAAIAVTDADAQAVQLALADGAHGDQPLHSGDTGIAGLAGLFVSARHAPTRDALLLNEQSRALLVSTEGPTPAC